MLQWGPCRVWIQACRTDFEVIELQEAGRSCRIEEPLPSRGKTLLEVVYRGWVGHTSALMGLIISEGQFGHYKQWAQRHLYKITRMNCLNEEAMHYMGNISEVWVLGESSCIQPFLFLHHCGVYVFLLTISTTPPFIFSFEVPTWLISNLHTALGLGNLAVGGIDCIALYLNEMCKI